MRSHQRDLGSLFFGVLFAAVGVVYLLAAGDAITINGLWAIPATLAALGVGGLVAALPTKGNATTVSTDESSTVDP